MRYDSIIRTKQGSCLLLLVSRTYYYKSSLAICNISLRHNRTRSGRPKENVLCGFCVSKSGDWELVVLFLLLIVVVVDIPVALAAAMGNKNNSISPRDVVTKF